MQEPLLTFIIYAQEDRRELEEFKSHLQLLEKCGLLLLWDDGKIMPGGELEEEKKEKLNKADIVILLISSRFFEKSILEIELPRALSRRSEKKCQVIPIILKPCHWKVFPKIVELQPLPRTGKPVYSREWYSSDEALTHVVEEIETLANTLIEEKANSIKTTISETEVVYLITPPDLKKNILPDDVVLKFKQASHLLFQWKGDFEKLSNSHLPRKETTQLLNWIEAPLTLEEKGITLLVGEPGSGKSVILRDVLHVLEERQIPVLGIKADRYCVESIQDLEKRLNLREGIETMTRVLMRTSDRVVVLIDQIDALSQSLSARREYLDTFNQLVASLIDVPGVRIVISCRTYDLQNDHDFSHYRRQKHIKVGKLEIAEVTSILQRLPGKIPKLSNDLLELLRIPLYLDVFCRVYRVNLPLEKIKALQDLYSELWQQKVVEISPPTEKKVSTEKCAQLIDKLAQAMYAGQNLAVSAKPFRADFLHELKYLKSEGIIYETQENVAFFHQTFYDFAFARQFTESGDSIEKYLHDNGQSLHIRACLKMMIEFLRERDPQEYLRVYRAILPSPDYYFHIKSLLISVLGFVKKPNDAEIQLVQDLILTEPSLFKAFLASINSREWLLFLFEEKKLDSLFLPDSIALSDDGLERERNESRMQMLNSLLTRHLPESSNEVLEFLWTLPETAPQTWLIQNALNKLESWDNPLTFKLFDAFGGNINNAFFDDFMKKAAMSDLTWALGHLKTAIEKQVVDKESSYGELRFEYSLAKLIEYFTEAFPEPTFDLLLEAQTQRLFAPEVETQQIDSIKIIRDFPWFSFDLDDDRRDSTGLFSLLIGCVRILARNESSRFERFVSENSDSNSATMLLILVEGFRANPITYISDIARFFKIFLENKGFDSTDNLDWRARQLLKESYPLFTNLQRESIIHLVAQIESESEKEWAMENNKPEWIGHIRFKWLKYLPEADLIQVPNVGETFRELEQQFPEFEDREPNRIRVYGIGPPMEEYEYTNMMLSEWKSSFSQFDEKFEHKWGSSKGGLEQHARKFEDEVKKRPDFFYPLIEELIEVSNLSKEYLIHGLRGLKEAKYSPESILDLFKKIDLTDWEESQVYWLVSLCGYFVNEKIEDDYFFHFLVQMATIHPDPKDESIKVRVNKDENKSVYVTGFNTVRGSATHLLPYCYYLQQHESLLFETLENIAEHDLLSVRSQMMPRLALLTNLDKPRTLRLFLLLTQDNESVVMEHSAWSAQYLARQDFDGMKPYIERALAHPNLHENMGIILALTWVFGRNDALPLLNRYVEQSDKAKAGAIEVAAHNILDEHGEPISRSLELFARFLGESGEEVIHAYDAAFRQLKPLDFPHLQPMFVQFAQTVIVRKNPRPFYEYLITCATSFPEQCLDLVDGFAQYEKPDIRYSGYYDREPLKVVINAYNTLWGRRKKDLVLLDKALRLFDRMLLDDRFRRDAETALDEVER